MTLGFVQISWQQLMGSVTVVTSTIGVLLIYPRLPRIPPVVLKVGHNFMLFAHPLWITQAIVPTDPTGNP